jgi:hypothetical protein
MSAVVKKCVYLVDIGFLNKGYPDYLQPKKE